MAQAGDDSSEALAAVHTPMPAPAASPLLSSATELVGSGVGSAAAANEDKTAALVATCSAMLSLALALRLLRMYLMQTRLKRGRRLQLAGLRLPVLLHALDVSVYVVLWYAVSIGMTLFNKWFLRVWANGGYPFATTMTCVNMFVKCLLSRVIDRVWSDARNCGASNATASRSSMAGLSANVYWKLAVPIGLCTALDIMLSNLSLFYITVTFYTIVKSGGNVWNLLFSICLGHQRPSWPLFGVIVLISSGIGLASYGSAQFVLHGFLLVLAASVIGTLRWVLTQSLLQAMDDNSSTGSSNPGSQRNKILAVVYYISPASALGLLPIALFSEAEEMATSRFLLDSRLLLLSLIFIFISGCLAFVLIFIEILLVKKTSALSLGIAGSFKDVTQVLLAVFIFGDQLIPVNVFGLVVATCGMLVYTFIKHSPSDPSDTKPGSYSRVPTQPPELEHGNVQAPGSNSKYKSSVPVYHMKDTAVTASGTKSSQTSAVRRESKEFFGTPGKPSSATHV